MPKGTILYVEDDPDLQDVVTWVLGNEGYQVAQAMNGADALRSAAREEPDLILLDLMLPDIDGYEVLRQLQIETVTRGIPVVIVSAKGEENDVVMGLTMGAQDYITKPFAPKELVARIAAVLRSRTNLTTVPVALDGRMTANPIFATRAFRYRENFCFVLMPFGLPWSKRVWTEIKDIVGKEGFDCKRADDIFGHDILEDIWSSVVEANVIIADITANNANVMYEIGIAHTLGKSVILLTQDIAKIPFDFKRFRHLSYEDNVEGFARLRQLLPNYLRGRRTGRVSRSG